MWLKPNGVSINNVLRAMDMINKNQPLPVSKEKSGRLKSAENMPEFTQCDIRNAVFNSKGRVSV